MTTDADREHFRRLEPAFREAETDEEPSPEVRRHRIAEANEWRAARGMPPLDEGPEDPPELHLYRRARSIGSRSHRR